MAQLEILPHCRAAQVKVSVFHAELVSAVGVVLYCEGRSLALADDIELRDEYLYVSSRQLLVL